MFSLPSLSLTKREELLLIGTIVNKFHQFKDSCHASQCREASLIQALCWGITHHHSATSHVASPTTVWVAVAAVVLALFNAPFMWGGKKEKQLSLPLPFCPQHSWLEVAKQSKFTVSHAKMVAAAVHRHTLCQDVPVVADRHPWKN